MRIMVKDMDGQSDRKGTFERGPFRGKGTYVLLISLSRSQQISVGCLGVRRFHSGSSAYIGSALSGFRARLGHHLGKKKRPHWHIDYLLQEASIQAILLVETKERTECAVAGALMGQIDDIPDFGSSDCRCRSHLFFAVTGKQLEIALQSAFSHLGYQPVLFQFRDMTADRPGRRSPRRQYDFGDIRDSVVLERGEDSMNLSSRRSGCQ